MNSEDAIIYSTIRAFISMQKKKDYYPNNHYSSPCGNADDAVHIFALCMIALWHILECNDA